MMTIASALTAMNTDIVNARTAITNKGGTVTSGGGSSQLATDIATIPSGGSAPVITSLNVTPTTSAQTITAPSGTDGYSPVNVAAVTAAIDSNIKANNIKSGVSILGVTGTVTELNGETRSVSITSTAGNTFTPTSGKNAITSITVTPNNQARSITPSTSAQTLNVNSGYSGNGTISVSAVTASIDANITAGNIKKDVQILGVTGSYEGSSGKYKIGDIIKVDSSNTEVGIVGALFTDSNNIEYAVVYLYSKYGANVRQIMSSNSTITNLPMYSDRNVSNCFNAKETATFNTQKILDTCTAQGYTSSACSECRKYSFFIDGTRYYGQLPNLKELVDIINNLDIARSDNAEYSLWSSTQYNSSRNWFYLSSGSISQATKTTLYRITPVLEIPNAL